MQPILVGDNRKNTNIPARRLTGHEELIIPMPTGILVLPHTVTRQVLKATMGKPGELSPQPTGPNRLRSTRNRLAGRQIEETMPPAGDWMVGAGYPEQADLVKDSITGKWRQTGFWGSPEPGGATVAQDTNKSGVLTPSDAMRRLTEIQMARQMLLGQLRQASPVRAADGIFAQMLQIPSFYERQLAAQQQQMQQMVSLQAQQNPRLPTFQLPPVPRLQPPAASIQDLPLRLSQIIPERQFGDLRTHDFRMDRPEDRAMLGRGLRNLPQQSPLPFPSTPEGQRQAYQVIARLILQALGMMPPQDMPQQLPNQGPLSQPWPVQEPPRYVQAPPDAPIVPPVAPELPRELQPLPIGPVVTPNWKTTGPTTVTAQPGTDPLALQNIQQGTVNVLNTPRSVPYTSWADPSKVFVYDPTINTYRPLRPGETVPAGTNVRIDARWGYGVPNVVQPPEPAPPRMPPPDIPVKAVQVDVKPGTDPLALSNLTPGAINYTTTNRPVSYTSFAEPEKVYVVNPDGSMRPLRYGEIVPPGTNIAIDARIGYGPVRSPVEYVPHRMAQGGFVDDPAVDYYRQLSPNAVTSLDPQAPQRWGDANPNAFQFAIYSPEAMGGMPFIRRLLSGQLGREFGAFAVPIGSERFALENVPFIPNPQTVARMMPSEQQMTRSLYEQGLQMYWPDIVAAMQRATPYAQGQIGTARYRP